MSTQVLHTASSASSPTPGWLGEPWQTESAPSPPFEAAPLGPGREGHPVASRAEPIAAWQKIRAKGLGRLVFAAAPRQALGSSCRPSRTKMPSYGHGRRLTGEA